MARKCASAAILETLRDPRVVTLPAAAQTLWIRVITAMQNSGISVLRFGSDIMKPSEIGLFVGIAETEIETHLGRLIERGLLRRDDDGAVICPMLAASMSRAEINRINGKRGGRPRKDASPPGQSSLMLPIDGGKMKTEKTESETETETEGGANGVPTTTYLSKESESKVSEEEYHQTGRAVLDAVGCDPAKSMMTYGLVRQWLADGADREMILAVVGKIMNREKKPDITNLKYFSRAIEEAIAARVPKKPAYEFEYDKAYAIWEVTGRDPDTKPRLADFKGRHAA